MNMLIEQVDSFYGYINLVLGAIFVLIGFKIYKPFAKDKEEEMYRKFGNLFKFGGIGLAIWGIIKIL